MEINYTNTLVDLVAQSEFTFRPLETRAAYVHYNWVAYWAVMAGLGVYVSMSFDMIFYAAVFVAMYLYFAASALPYARVRKSGLARLARLSAPRQIRLRLEEDGLQETVEGLVESFAPWPALRSFALTQSYLLIELAGDLWANVPRATVTEGEGALQEMISILRAHGVAQKAAGKP